MPDYNDYKECRYYDCLPKYLENCDVIEDKSDSDPYSGFLDVIFYDRSNNIYYYVEYCYGSCSGCDDWERLDLTPEEITKEIEQLTLKMTEEQYKIWLSRRDDMKIKYSVVD